MVPLGDYGERLERRVLSPLTEASWRFYAWVGFLLVLVGIAIYAYSTQLRDGLIVTDLSDRISWGMYISLFVFFIGISHAGTLISAILRASNAPWRMPVTRMAEMITVVALMVGGLMPILDLGRPDRLVNIFTHGRWQSPQIWDVVAISTYFTASMIFLYLPLIPDFAIARDRLPDHSRLGRMRKGTYDVLSLGWRGTTTQIRHHATALKVMMILIIPVAVSVHTVVSWIFSMTIRDPWNSTIFGVFFVAGAIFSGIAALIILMYVLRRVYHLEEYITPKHFRYLGVLLALFALIILYGNISEFLTPGYKGGDEAVFQANQLFTGPFAGLFWYYVFGGIVLPGAMFLIPWARQQVWLIVAASVMVLVGMFIERYWLVVSGLRVPLMPYEARDYAPTWVEWAIMVGALALFALIITIATKLLPVVSIWEVEEEVARETAAKSTASIPAGPVPVTGGGD